MFLKRKGNYWNMNVSIEAIQETQDQETKQLC